MNGTGYIDGAVGYHHYAAIWTGNNNSLTTGGLVVLEPGAAPFMSNNANYWSVGIGTLEPQEALHVKGNVTGHTGYFEKLYASSGTLTNGVRGRFNEALTWKGGVASYGESKPQHGDILMYHGSEPSWTNLQRGKHGTVLISRDQSSDGIEWVDPNMVEISTEIGASCSDESSPLTTGLKTTFRVPHGMRFYNSTGNAGKNIDQSTHGPGISASVTSYPSGQALIIDILESGKSLFNKSANSLTSGMLCIDKGERTSLTAQTGYVLDSTRGGITKPVSGLAYDAEISVVVRQVGGTDAKPWPGAGLKIQIRGVKGGSGPDRSNWW